MYTSYIGNNFLKIYRQRNNLPDEYSAIDFFNEVMFPLFYNDEEHLMHVHGSSFFQKVSDKDLVSGKSKQQFQLERLHRDIENKKISGSTYVGYAAETLDATTSGQVTSLNVSINSDEIYSSWIGQALAIGVSGGYAMQINEDNVLWTLYEGWEYYRRYLSQTPNLKDKQIETWNGQWLNYCFGKNFDRNNKDSFFNYLKLKIVQGNLAIPTIDWVKIIFALSRQYPNQVLTAYAYNLSQTNTTLGFINIILPKVKSLILLKELLYVLPENGQYEKEFEEVYSTYYHFLNACKLGIIGLKALEPDKLRDYMPNYTSKYKIKYLKIKTKEDIINFTIYKIWIIAMLNNKKELNALAEQVAQLLIDLENEIGKSESGRGKSSQSRISEDFLFSKSVKEFIENLTNLMKKYSLGAEVFKKVKDAVIELPSDLFSLFVTLIQFEDQFKKSNK